MRHSYSFSLIVAPLAMLLIMVVTLLIQRTGFTYEVNAQYYKSEQFLQSEILEVKNYFPDKSTETLIVYDSQSPIKGMFVLLENVSATLDSMRVNYDLYDVNSGENIDFVKYKVLVFAVLDLSKLDAQALDIIDWVTSGGRILFTIRPDISATGNMILGYTGAVNTSESLVLTQGVEFISDLLPGTKGSKLGLDFIESSSYFIELDENECSIHIISADSNKIPILWECNVENGRVVFVNSDQFGTKDSRGLIGASYSLLFDTIVYPVINSSVFYIDDFPAPLPEGSNELILKFYNMNNQSFFRQIWWEDMRKIADTYGIRFTVGMIETYENNLIPPLPKQLELESHKYFGSAILAANGEIIYHGYNHVPYCKQEDNINKLNGYPVWPSTENAQLSMVELYGFGKQLFGDYRFLGYIPPSNILCPESRRWLPTVIPDLRYIASVYLPDLDGHEYLQEFTESVDGVIEFPRIVAGYDMTDDEYARWAVINELSLHYVNSHFVHPDDMLDLDRHAEKGWDDLRGQYTSFISWLRDSAPGLRNTTGSEGAMAVQRFSRLAVDMRQEDGSLEILLGNFYDEAWLILRSKETPLSIDGGEIIQISTNQYLIQALDSKILILFEE